MYYIQYIHFVIYIMRRYIYIYYMCTNYIKYVHSVLRNVQTLSLKFSSFGILHQIFTFNLLEAFMSLKEDWTSSTMDRGAASVTVDGTGRKLT